MDVVINSVLFTALGIFASFVCWVLRGSRGWLGVFERGVVFFGFGFL